MVFTHNIHNIKIYIIYNRNPVYRVPGRIPPTPRPRPRPPRHMGVRGGVSRRLFYHADRVYSIYRITVFYNMISSGIYTCRAGQPVIPPRPRGKCWMIPGAAPYQRAPWPRDKGSGAASPKGGWRPVSLIVVGVGQSAEAVTGAFDTGDRSCDVKLFGDLRCLRCAA